MDPLRVLELRRREAEGALEQAWLACDLLGRTLAALKEAIADTHFTFVELSSDSCPEGE